MPIRSPKERKTCSLPELLNWVAHDDFSGPNLTSSEVAAEIFGEPDNVEEIEIAQYSRTQSEEAAKDDIINALADEDIVALGHFSDHSTFSAANWQKSKYADHSSSPQLIPADSWRLGNLDWENSSLKLPTSEYLKVHFRREDVLGIWKPTDKFLSEEDTTAKKSAPQDPIDDASVNDPQRTFTQFRDQLVIALYRKSEVEGLKIFPLKEITDENVFFYREGWIREVQGFLDDNNYALVTKTIGGEETCAAKLNSNGLEYVENLLANSSDITDPQSVPASDRIVSQSDNQETWDQATKSIDNVIAEFKEDHKTFGNESVHEKTALIRTLEAGRDLLNEEVIKVQMGIVLLLDPLKMIRTRVEEFHAKHSGVKDSLIASLITEAIKFLSKLFGF